MEVILLYTFYVSRFHTNTLLLYEHLNWGTRRRWAVSLYVEGSISDGAMEFFIDSALPASL